MGPQLILTAAGVALWFLAGAWAAFTGPQNLPGWIFMAMLPALAASIAKVAAWRINRRTQ